MGTLIFCNKLSHVYLFSDRQWIEQHDDRLVKISQDGNQEADNVKEMLESAVRMIWDSALCYKMAP